MSLKIWHKHTIINILSILNRRQKQTYFKNLRNNITPLINWVGNQKKHLSNNHIKTRIKWQNNFDWLDFSKNHLSFFIHINTCILLDKTNGDCSKLKWNYMIYSTWSRSVIAFKKLWHVWCQVPININLIE